MRRAELSSTLTHCELQVAQLQAEGLSMQAIADRLGKSEQTVKIQLASARLRLGVHNAGELANKLRELRAKGAVA
jgi:DNA-binding NarL/FixJ family response regulator